MNEYKTILVAKMYTGEFIEKNIGHEIINFFKPDNKDCYYGYIINNGKIENNLCRKIDTILLVSDVKERKVKVLAKIDNPTFISNTENTNEKQVKYIIDNDIRYGGVLLNDIMSKNYSDNEIYITYKAEKIDVPEEDYYLLLKGNDKKEDDNNIKISWNIGHNRGYINKITDSTDYNKIIKLINNMKWNKIKEKRINENNLMPKDNNGNDMFKIISYYDIFKYFNKESLKYDMKNNKYYEYFVISLSKHIYTLDEEMERRFVSTIKNRITQYFKNFTY